jgi:hypothetical protein
VSPIRQADRRLDGGYAMNMRAAEAKVSNPPNAMKTFPISDA